MKIGGQEERTHQAKKRHAVALSAIVEEALVKNGKQRVENGAVSFEDFVHKCYSSGRQVPICFANVLIFFKCSHG